MSTTPKTRGNEMGAAQVANRLSESQQPLEDLSLYLKAYAREKPEMAALWCFGIGFVLGWKLKPW
ncbi:hypothetical protein [Planctomicrobium sp. SH664]|uniref:hypothetical protein n=1 Tax=Planctomicrobium sp. SH664 TaxID=3448125 RepID=UPI003F5C0A6B